MAVATAGEEEEEKEEEEEEEEEGALTAQGIEILQSPFPPSLSSSLKAGHAPPKNNTRKCSFSLSNTALAYPVNTEEGERGEREGGRKETIGRV